MCITATINHIFIYGICLNISTVEIKTPRKVSQVLEERGKEKKYRASAPFQFQSVGCVNQPFPRCHFKTWLICMNSFSHEMTQGKRQKKTETRLLSSRNSASSYVWLCVVFITFIHTFIHVIWWQCTDF